MRAVARMAGGLAHELNNLLMVLGGNLDFLRGRLAGAGVPLDEVTEMGDALAEARALAGELAAIGRRRRRGPRRVELAPALAAAAPALQAALAPDCTLDVAPVSADLAALVDPAALAEALAALAAGAREGVRTLRRMDASATAEGPAAATLTATGRTLDAGEAEALGLAPGTWVAIALRAPGPGAPADAPHAFEPFHTPDGRGKGALLRLAVAWALARHEGGAATADNPAPGERVLTLWLPEAPTGGARDPEGESAAAPMPPERSRPTDAASPASARSILVVDDEPGVRGTIRRVLERGGHAVLEAPDGHAALALLDRVGVAPQGGAIALILTDLQMPGLSADALLARLRERWPGLPVLCMTGLVDGGADAARPRDANVPVLDKPFEAGTLLAHVRAALVRTG